MMLLPRLSPLQSRFVVSAIALITLLLLYYFSSAPIFAYALNVESDQQEDSNHHERSNWSPPLMLDPNLEFSALENGSYQPDSAVVDEEIIVRQSRPMINLSNNIMMPIKVEKGQLVPFTFTSASLWSAKSSISFGLPSQVGLTGKKESGFESKSGDFGDSKAADQRRLYITVTTCLQPQDVVLSMTAPQLQLFISDSPNNISPGPLQNASSQKMVELVGGYALFTVDATGDVFIGVYAKNESSYSGSYSAQIAASIDAPYHSRESTSDPNLFVADRDSRSALLYTDPFIRDATNTTLVAQWMNTTPPFVMFLIDSPDIFQQGIQNSYCGLQNSADISAVQNKNRGRESHMETGITRQGSLSLPRQQFFIDGLRRDRTYTVALAMNGNPTKSEGPAVGGGGIVYQPTSFSTLADENCKVIHDLSFCDQVAYSVPWNPNKFSDVSSLAALYDNSTKAIYDNFQKVLAQIPCETTASAQYSLARTCDDCAQAYKTWLCAVNIPRCTDIDSKLPWLQSRAVEQAFPNGSYITIPLGSDIPETPSAAKNSRNANIDLLVSPGPYKEVLPCQELCYNLVASCPAALGFSCPQPGQTGFNTSYGQMPVGWADKHGRNTNITCNFPGMVYFSGAARLISPLVEFVVAMFFSLFMIAFTVAMV